MLKRNAAMLLSLCLIYGSLFTFFPMSTLAATQATYYVDPVNGNDNNNGTSTNSAFHSIAKARDVVRTINSNMSGDIIVNLMAGEYQQSSTLTFGTSDSGTYGYNVIYQAYNSSDQPIISGGKKITGWSLYDSGKNIYRASVGTSDNFRQIYVNDSRAIRARWPNSGSTIPIVNYDSSSKCVTVNNYNTSSSWGNTDKIELAIRGDWVQQFIRISTISIDSNYAYIYLHSGTDDYDNQIFNQGSPCYRYNALWYENAYDFIDQEGEWYLDTATHYLYYKPRSGESMSSVDVHVPVIEKIVSVQGTDLSNMTHNIQFNNVKFMYGNWLFPSNHGFLEEQANQWFKVNSSQQISFTPDGAGVYMKNAYNLRVEGCTFKNMGCAGLDIDTGTHDITIIGNVFKEIAGNGIMAGMFTPTGYGDTYAYNPTDSREISQSVTIKDNYITKVAQVYCGGCGIAAGFVKDYDIEHNELYDLPYSGISLGWAWTSSSNAMSGNKIKYNYVHNIMNYLCDGGAIYTLSNQPNTEIKRNYINGVNNNYAAIYLDQGSSNMTVDYNVIDNCVSYYLLIQWDDYNDTIDHTYTSQSSYLDNGENTYTLTNTTVVAGGNWPSEAQTIMSEAGLESAYLYIRDGGSSGGGDVTVDLSDRPTADTELTGSYAYIDWGSQLWKTYQQTGGNKALYIGSSSTSEVSQTFTIPSGKVLKNIKLQGGDATNTVKISSTGNTEQVWNNLSSTWGTYNTNWTTAASTITVKVTSSGACWNVHLDDIVYGDVGGSTPTPTPTPTPTSGKYTVSSASASSEYSSSYAAAKAIDGNIGTWWSANGNIYPSSLTLDLGSAQTVNETKIAFGSPSTRQYYFDVQVSTDGTNYTTVVNNKLSTTATWEDDTFTSVNAQYVKINITSCTNTGNWPGFYESEVYGASGSTPTPTPTPTPIFSEGFEDGFGSWTAIYGTPTASTAQKHGGSYSFNSDEDADYITHSMDSNTNKVLIAWFYDNTADTNEEEFVFAGNNTVGLGVSTTYGPSATKYTYRLGSTYYDSGVNRTTGWHQYVFDYRSGSDVKLYVDQTLVATSTSSTYFTTIRIGDAWGSYGTTAGYFDDISVQDNLPW